MNAIIVLGSSFIEALPVPPESCAESIFFAKIKKNDRNYQVINLGYSGHDPYDSYLRLLYYEKYYHPSKVLLVLNSNNSEWLNRHNYPFNFEESDNFGKKQSGIKIKSMKFLKNHLSSFNLIANFILNSDENINNAESGQTNTNQDISHVQKLIKLFDCLSAFKKKYANNFLCFSVNSDSIFNKIIDKWCMDNKINFIYPAFSINFSNFIIRHN